MQADIDGLDVRAMFRRLRRRKRLMAIITAVVFAAGMLHAVLQRPDYESTARLLISSKKRPGLSSLANIPMPADLQSIIGGATSVETEAEILSDDQLLQSAYERLSSAERKMAYGEEPKLPKWAVKVKPKRGTDVLEIRVLSHSPKASAHLGRAIVNIYFERGFDENSRSLRKARSYTLNKMQLLGKQLSAAHSRLAAYKRATRLVVPQAQMEHFAEYTTSLQTELDTALTRQAAGRQQIATLERQVSAEEPDVVSGNVIRQNPRFAAKALTIDQLYSKRAEMLQEFQPKSPELQTLNAQIKQEEAGLKETAGTIIDSIMHTRNPIRDTLLTSYASEVAKKAATDASVAVLRRKMDDQSKIAASLPEKERQLLELQGQVDLFARAHGLVSDQYYNLLLSEQQATPTAQLLSNAIPKPDPVSLSLSANAALFLVLGALAALVAALVVDSLDNRIQEAEDAEQASGYFASTVVPLAQGVSPLIVRTGPATAMLESFRVLRNKVYFAGIDQQLKTLAITSARAGEGKTLTCANLAAAIAMDVKTVVAVDCNMERPGIRHLIGTPCDFGLTHVLMGVCDLDKATVQGAQDNLFLVPSGPVVLNFPELLNSQRGREAFAQLKGRFDYVLIDCPPVSNLSDLQMICSIADGILLVTRLGRTLASDLSAASDSLSSFGVPIVGLVVNGDAERAGHDSFVRSGNRADEFTIGEENTAQPRH